LRIMFYVVKVITNYPNIFVLRMNLMQDTLDAPPPPGHGRLLPVPDSENCLDTKQLQDLEHSFRRWANSSKRQDHRKSRDRILLIFLIIRYTGARLNEVLNLDLLKDFDCDKNTFRFCKRQSGKDSISREVQIPETISVDIRTMTADSELRWPDHSMFRIDPAHVRRKFYEQAVAIGIHSGMGTPETIRKSRAVELMRSNMPLQVVQKILGHSTPNLAASYVEFSDSEIRQVAGYFADRENRRKTSARNAFFGKINTIRRGDIQTVIEVASLSGSIITSVITSDSLARIGLKPGMLITAEVKAPWVQLCGDETAPRCSAENMFRGTVCRITKNRTTAEIVVRLLDGTELCAVITEKSRRQMDIHDQSVLWAFFDAFAVILHVD
jgi:molybdate transport system regulatory protein